MLEIALYQPDMAANTGTIARLCACLGLPLTIIEPAGFAWSDSGFRRAGMDYLTGADIRRAASWEVFQEERQGRRLILLTTRGALPYTGFAFADGDVLLLGRETAGVPDSVHATCTGITIPMKPGMRSLNVAMACAMVTGEALRQLGQLPPLSPKA